LVEVVNRYLGEEITAFALDEALFDIRTRTKDETVKQVSRLLWYHYDDIHDHKVVASKEQWDYFQRLLLVLKSDAEIVKETGKRTWTARQTVAAACLGLVVIAIAKSGFGYHLLLATVPLGFVSMLLAYWYACVEARRLHDQTALTPFDSVAVAAPQGHRLRQSAVSRSSCFPADS
jgi:hypothetical protein